jgi:alcohol dehydrogenase YqhD (iron-dependent ADH family)
MKSFIAYNPTKLFFGRNAVGDLGEQSAGYGQHALLVYGGGSVFRNGSYGDTRKQLEQKQIRITEFRGIKPNPLVDDVMEAARLGREQGVDMVVAVGGGSVIDSAKIIAICIPEACDAWELMTGKYEPSVSLPLITVLTLAATGTEMNPAAVLQNKRTGQKIGLRHALNYPTLSFLDPSYTLTVPADYTAYGIVDLVAHCLEAWFGEGDATLSDRFVIAIIREAMEFGHALLSQPDNYDLRAKIMWAATNALNNLTLYGRTSGDWGVHALGHVLSFLFDTPHGATLSVIYPAWMKLIRERDEGRIGQLGKELFGKQDAGTAIDGLEGFFNSLGSPVRCPAAGIGPERREEILELMNWNRAQGSHHKLSDADRGMILSHAFSTL